MKSLLSEVINVDPNHKDTISWKTLLTTIVENLHAVRHFKHETFDVLQNATDFGTKSKESLKRITKWGEYFTYPSSYYPVPQTGILFKDVRFMTPLPPDELSKEEEQTMKDWLENYCPVRQRTARSETSKDKAGTLPPAVYSNANPNATARVLFPADQVEQTSTASSEMIWDALCCFCVRVEFRKRCHSSTANLAPTADFNQVEECESDSDDSDNDVDIESEEPVIGKLIMTRSGRQVKVWTSFDV